MEWVTLHTVGEKSGWGGPSHRTPTHHVLLVAGHGGMAWRWPSCCQTGKMAICWHSRFSVQQLCQHLAFSPVPSFKSNTTPLCCFTLPQSLLPPEGEKTHSLVKNTGSSLKQQSFLVSNFEGSYAERLWLVPALNVPWVTRSSEYLLLLKWQGGSEVKLSHKLTMMNTAIFTSQPTAVVTSAQYCR